MAGAKDPHSYPPFSMPLSLEEMKDVVFHGKKDEYWTSASPHLSLLDCVSHATILNAPGSTSHGVN